ncbi:MAG: rod shape-determining protein MreC [Rickettsiales bacterium]|jgi:cell shape-determining protein MreC|nr:rod shape-determining protein MreC [Rickettsiales bacterium]
MQQKKSFLSASVSIVSVVIAVIVILIDKPDYRFFNFLHRNTIPIAEAVAAGASYPFRLVGRMVRGIRDSRDALSEDAEVRRKMDEFDKVFSENEILRRENELLREKAGMQAALPKQSIIAEIVRDDSFASRQSFFVKNRGGGVRGVRRAEAGNVVLSNGGQLLGIVSESLGGYARIQTLRDGKSNIPVRIAGTNIFGFLQGTGPRADPELAFLSDGDYIPQPGQLLITSGVMGNLPGDIPVGRIKKVAPGGIPVLPGAELNNQESAVILLFDKDGKYE